ncbi:cell death activator CIDE-3-like [Boleophthalmus pectinirostris]|uniref:cell death activator CIDE-3-like n=1 Tax=Boleophthalmus pectinirostris TaxID=150288 RepID=UPI002431DB59|nr:cell death activator CIDE-3-like [Boleophthalmus pectinirostris]
MSLDLKTAQCLELTLPAGARVLIVSWRGSVRWTLWRDNSIMDYASKYISLLAPSSLSKSLTVPPRPKPFRVTNADRSTKKGLTAHGLEDLLHKVKESLAMSYESTLVLDEDGTEIDTEDFFQTLPVNTVFMILDKGQKWSPLLSSPRDQLRKCEQDRTDVAKITLDLYKNNPKDFIGCLNVKATLYGAYSVSYDLRCHAAKKLLKEALRWTVFSMQATGHLLLGSSCYIEQLLEDEGKMSLMLPSDSMVKHLQGMLLRRPFY